MPRPTPDLRSRNLRQALLDCGASANGLSKHVMFASMTKLETLGLVALSTTPGFRRSRWRLTSEGALLAGKIRASGWKRRQLTKRSLELLATGDGGQSHKDMS